jgi:hypothetical protein
MRKISESTLVSLDDLMAFENPMVLEGMEAAMQMNKES